MSHVFHRRHHRRHCHPTRPRRHRRRAAQRTRCRGDRARADRPRRLRASARDADDRIATATGGRSTRPSSLTSRSAFLYRRRGRRAVGARQPCRSRRDRRARRPRAGARLANPGEFTLPRVSPRRIDLVQAEAVGELIDAVTPLQARVAFDQLEGTLTLRLREIDRALLDLIAPLEASLDFPDEGYHFITPAGAARGAAGDPRVARRAAGGRGARPADPRRTDRRDRRAAERRQIEPVQSACRRGARDRHRRSRHDSRSADRARRRRRRAVDDGRHGRPARRAPATRSRRKGSRARGRRRRRRSASSSSSIDRGR